MIARENFEKHLSHFKSIKPILVIGDVGIDKYTFGDVKRISPEAPVPILEVSKEWLKLGLAANVVDNLKSLEVESSICGVVGDDLNASVFENLLEEEHLKTWGVVRDPSRRTTVKERVTTNSQQICRIDHENLQRLDNEAYVKLSSRIDDLVPSHSAIILEDYGKGMVSQKLCEKLISVTREQDMLLAVDPSRSTPPMWYEGVTLLKPNQLESRLMAEALGYFNETSVATIAEILVDKLKLEKLLITLGPNGMAILDTKDDGKLKTIPTVANEVFDVSGAGDTAISTLVAALSVGASLEDAAWIGNCASGVVVGKKGTATVTQKELTDFYDVLQSNL